mmetsp:Transcript_82655/g.198362  ORF Transcript_82655/g.198362 Transcript_82655/m.198362 type:complete len:208 (+) Transcript_82655:885-1508(+)
MLQLLLPSIALLIEPVSDLQILNLCGDLPLQAPLLEVGLRFGPRQPGVLHSIEALSLLRQREVIHGSAQREIRQIWKLQGSEDHLQLLRRQLHRGRLLLGWVRAHHRLLLLRRLHLLVRGFLARRSATLLLCLPFGLFASLLRCALAFLRGLLRLVLADLLRLLHLELGISLLLLQLQHELRRALLEVGRGITDQHLGRLLEVREAC